jgi:ribosome biogenesis GTPase
MVPKYRGTDDDWLDDQSKVVRQTRSNQRPKRQGLAAEAEALPWEESNATVIEVYPRQCRVLLDEESPQKKLLVTYRRAKVLGHSSENKEDWRERSPVTVGDRVQVELSGPQTGVVRGVCARRNQLVRPAPGKDITKQRIFHAVAANVDCVVIVASSKSPDFNSGLVDRYLIATQAAGIRPILCVTKVDLFQKSEASAPWDLYRELGIDVFEVNARSGEGVAPLRESLLGISAVFCGNSGVGKTSLLSCLMGQSAGKVQNVSSATGKGQHTTTVSIMIDGPQGSRWIDTPGVREFGLVGLSRERIRDFFDEFSALPCHLLGCSHLPPSARPDCSAPELPRYPSYRRIAESVDDGSGGTHSTPSKG